MFSFEGCETIHIFKFKSKKMGLDFSIVRKESLETTATITLTLEEFKILQEAKDPVAVMQAKKIFKGELVPVEDLKLV